MYFAGRYGRPDRDSETPAEIIERVRKEQAGR
jgi:hypothetical protein